MTPGVAHLAAAIAAALEDPDFAAVVSQQRRSPSRPSSMLSEPMLDAATVAGLLGIPTKTVHQYAREGRLPSYKVGRRTMFVRREVEAAVSAGQLR
ncbi:helix-turn-helix domain-containing protein [Baekduia soli]|uniref:Helix-turn-helix domain-containing protein n=1 Tax=Baekduia soli TaxID=496014 RepID=A0A5B8U8E0_9ACTN|nr:helix-turn-helix domain-containing protein [Baekduia soli]QEC49217.1 helix-turn-helix domain-containing protein [Baekduia soli]